LSILSELDRSFLRRLAVALPARPTEYADLFLERTRHLSFRRDREGGGPAIAGGAEGSAARLMTADQVRHAAIGSLDPAEVAALPQRLRASGGPSGAPGEDRPAPADAPPARAAGGRDRGAALAAAGAADVDRYLEEVRAAALGAAGPGAAAAARFEARAECVTREVAVVTSEGEVAEDRRDWVAFSARFDGTRRDAGPFGVSEGGGAVDLGRLRAVHPPSQVGERLGRALREGREAVPPPSGEMMVVLAPGPGGILFHEACGHALEGDRALKGRSALVDLFGEKVGPEGLTLVDDPTLAGLPGSMRVDDEGWPAARNVLIESGRVVGLLLDRATALLAGTTPTGSARRESYRDLPLPRMSNTFILEGTHPPGEILASVARGLYVAELGTGEVDTVTADFSFSVRRGYLIAGGRAVAPVAAAVVSGNGLRALRGIEMIGMDLRFDAGAGECGKEGQRARASVGQPTIKVAGLSVHPAGTR